MNPRFLNPTLQFQNPPYSSCPLQTWSWEGHRAPVSGSGWGRRQSLPCPAVPLDKQRLSPVVTAPALGPWQERAGKCHCRHSQQGEMGQAQSARQTMLRGHPGCRSWSPWLDTPCCRHLPGIRHCVCLLKVASFPASAEPSLWWGDPAVLPELCYHTPADCSGVT